MSDRFSSGERKSANPAEMTRPAAAFNQEKAGKQGERLGPHLLRVTILNSEGSLFTFGLPLP
jgi:hypothetical protein